MTFTYKMAPPGPPPGEGPGESGDGQTVAAAPMTNGPSGASEVAGNQLWEKPWTIDEIRKGAGNWSLAGDAGLLLFLQEFSQRMISRTHEIEKEVDGLVHQAKISNVQLDNVFNDFIMLANTQFVENRVYDEDVSQETTKEEDKKPEEQEKTREQREAELIPKVSEALNYGIKVINNAFETLDVNAMNSDSEDEDIPYRADPILEPKDPYVTRPLPHIIGTPLFMQEDDVGLTEPPSDEESESHGSISESESEKDQSEESSEAEYSDTESEGSSSEAEKPSRPVKQKVIHSTSSEESEEDGDLFGGKDSEAETDEEAGPEEAKPTQKAGGPMDFTSELAAKIGVAPKPPPAQESDNDDQSGDTKAKVKKERSESSVSKGKKKHEHKHRERSKSKMKTKENAPVEEDSDPFGAPSGGFDDDSPFGGKGLFSASKGLFDDDEDSGGLFDDIEKPKPKVVEKTPVAEEEEEEPVKEETRPRTRSGKKVPTGGVSIFGGGDDELFNTSTLGETIPAPSKTKPAVSGGLFDDDDDNDGDLFSSPPAKPASKTEKSKPAATKAVDSLFAEDEDDDLFGGQGGSEVKVDKKVTEKPKKKLPAGAVSMFGNAPNPLAAALKQKLLGSNSEDEAEDEKAEPEGDKTELEEEKSRSGSLKSSHSSNSSLNKPVEAVKRGGKPSPSGSSNSLFADEPEDDLFSTKPPPLTSNSQRQQLKDVRRNRVAELRSSGKSAKKKPSLFGDDEEEEADLFGGGGAKEAAAKKTAKPVEKKLPPKDSLFSGETPPEDDLFGSMTAKPRADSGRKRPIGGVALFGGQDLFGKKDKPPEESAVQKEKPLTESKSEVSKPSPRKNTLSLFDDDEGEDLFGDGAKTTAKGGTKPDSAPKSTDSKPETKSRTKSKSLFEDEDVLFGGPQEDNPSVDLFGETPPVTPQKTATKAKVPTPSKPPGGGVTLQGATTTSTSSDLFGSDDKDEDLFGDKPQTESQPKVKDGKINLDDATTTETSDEPVEKKEAEPPKPKKPAGAVSMFGGLDPFAELKKKQRKTESTEAKDPLFDEDAEDGSLFAKPAERKISEPGAAMEGEPKPVAAKPKKPAGAVSMFGGVDPLGGFKPGAKPEQKEDKPEEDLFENSSKGDGTEKTKDTKAGSLSPPAPRAGVGKLKSNLLINPAALLPGAAPPQKEAEPVAVGFDQPAEVATLHSETKDRAKILSRRRPQSRKARKQAASSSDFGLDADEVATSTESSPSSHSAGSPEKRGAKSAPVTDLFGNDDMLGESAKVTRKSDPILTLGDEDDIFQKDFTRTSSRKAPAAIMEEDDDLFATSTKKSTTSKGSESTGDDLFSGIQSKKSSGLSDINTDPVLAIENSSTSKLGKEKPSGDISKGDKPVEKSKTTSVPDEDDIFADSSIMKKKDPKPKTETDDLFSDSILNKPPAKTEEKFGDEDIFSAPVKKEKKKKSATKDEDLFKDDTDIFADLPASKPKEKKKKKSTTAKKSVFKDDVDDIFADSGVSTKSKKDSEKKKKSTSKKKEDVVDIFDDPLNAAAP